MIDYSERFLIIKQRRCQRLLASVITVGNFIIPECHERFGIFIKAHTMTVAEKHNIWL